MGVEADDDSLAQEQGGPHDDVPDRAFPPVMKDKVEHHPKAHEEAEEHWVKEAKADGQDIFMYNSRHSEHKQHGTCAESLLCQPEEVPVGVVVQPVVHHHIPCAIVIGKRCRVPPVLVEHAVPKTKHLSEGVEPTVEEGKEGQKENKCTWEDGVEDTKYHGPQVKELHTDAPELWDAEAYKHVVGIEQTAKHLRKLCENITPSYAWISGVVISVNKGGGKEKVEILSDLGDHWRILFLFFFLQIQDSWHILPHERMCFHHQTHLFHDDDKA